MCPSSRVKSGKVLTQHICGNIFCGYPKHWLHENIARQVQQASWTNPISTNQFLSSILSITKPMHGQSIFHKDHNWKRGSILPSNPTKAVLETLRGLFPAGTACSLEEPLSLLHKHCGQVRHLHCGKYLVQIRRHVALLQKSCPQVSALGPFWNLTSE